jgi:hypothetical protein
MQKLSARLVHLLHEEGSLCCQRPKVEEEEVEGGGGGGGGKRSHEDLLELASSNENALKEITSKLRESFQFAVDINITQSNGRFSIECPLLMLEEGNPFVCMHTGHRTEISFTLCMKESIPEEHISYAHQPPFHNQSIPLPLVSSHNAVELILQLCHQIVESNATRRGGDW